ncbi:MAG: zinc-ribbon domain-containing protein [Candidatus Heimdallarchaeaceae archaeon]
MKDEKMFCDDCGAKLSEKTKFCKHCGATVGNVTPPQQPAQRQNYAPPQQSYQHTSPQPVTYTQPVAYATAPPISKPQKSAGVAVALNVLLIVGLGQIYAGRTMRGLAFMAGYYSLITGVIISIWYYWFVAFFIFPVLAFGLAMWSHVDAFLVTQEFNKKALQGQVR